MNFLTISYFKMKKETDNCHYLYCLGKNIPTTRLYQSADSIKKKESILNSCLADFIVQKVKHRY